MNFPNLEELSFLTVLALPKASKIGLALSSCCSSSPCNKKRIKSRQWWGNKAKKTRHPRRTVNFGSQIRESFKNWIRKLGWDNLHYVFVYNSNLKHNWVPFLGHWKTKTPCITIISCASQSNEFEPFSTATDKSQGLPVRPTEIEDINNKSQTVNNKRGQDKYNERTHTQLNFRVRINWLLGSD